MDELSVRADRAAESQRAVTEARTPGRMWPDVQSLKGGFWLVPQCLLLHIVTSLGHKLREDSRLDEGSTMAGVSSCYGGLSTVGLCTWCLIPRVSILRDRRGNCKASSDLVSVLIYEGCLEKIQP